MPLSSLDLPRKVTSTVLALLLVTSFAAMILPVPMIYSDNAFGEFATSDPANLLGNSLAKMEGLELGSRLPFIQNDGQVNSDVRFYVDTFAGRVYVRSNGLTYDLEAGSSGSGMAVSESFINANTVQPYGNDRSTAVVNHFVGEKSNWRTNIATFNGVSFGKVWDGIVVDLKAANNNVEKIFTLAPGANVHNIQIAMEGITELRVGANGELFFGGELGSASLTAPVAYQEINGEIRSVSVSYVVNENGQYGFALGSDYDPNYSVVIDPLLASTYIGGSLDDGPSVLSTNNELAGELAIDSTGNVFLTGISLSDNYPTTAGTYQTTDPTVAPFEFPNVVVSKFDSNLSTLLASTYLGGSAFDEAFGIAIDGSNNVFIVGKTNSSDFPIGPSPHDASYNGGFDVFVSKLSNNLQSLDGSTFIGGTDLDDGRAMTIHSGDIYITGWTDSSDYPTVGGVQGDAANRDVIVSQLDNNLSTLVASTYIGGSGIDEGHAIAMNWTNTGILVAGRTTSANYPTVGAYDSTHGGSSDAFVSLLNPDLGALIGSTYLGGSALDVAYGIVSDASSSFDVYVTGRTLSADFPTTGGYDNSHNGDYDVFVSRLAYHLQALESSTFLGSSNADFATDIEIGPDDDIYVAAHAGLGYPTTTGAYDESHNGNNEAAISLLSANLGSLIASTFVGGLEVESPTSLAQNSGGDVYLAGITSSTNFPVTPGSYDTSKNGDVDLFVAKLTANLANSYHLLVDNANGDCEAIGGSWSAPTCTLNTSFTLSGGNLMTIDSGVTLSIGSSGSLFINIGTVDNFGDIDNLGSIDLSGSGSGGTLDNKAGGSIAIASAATLSINHAGLLLNEAGATIHNTGIIYNYIGGFLTNDGSISLGGTINNSGSITNTATLDIFPGGIILNSATIDNSGTIGSCSNPGIIDSALSGITNTGTICSAVLLPDGTVFSTDYTVTFPLRVASGRTMTINPGVTFTLTSDSNSKLAVVNTGTTVNNGGTINNAGGIDIFTGSVLVNTGTIANSGTIGSISNPGIIDSDLSGIVNTGSIHSNVRIPDGTTFSSDYTVTFPLLVALGRSMTIDPGVTFTLTSASTSRLTVTNTGSTVYNEGTLDNAGSLTIFTGAKIVNTGTINNSVTIGSSTNPGTIENDCGGTINNTGTIHPTVVNTCTDSSPPTAAIAINGGAPTTDNPGVTIELTCDDGSGSGCASAVLQIDDPGSNLNANSGADLELHLHVRSSSYPSGLNIIAYRPDDTGSIYEATFALTNNPPQPNAIGYNAGDTIYVSHVYAQDGTKSASIKFEDVNANTGSFVSDSIDLTATANSVGHWALDEGTGFRVHDGAGFDNQGILGNSPLPESSDPTWVSGHVGTGALAFDGLDDFVTIGSHPNLWVTSGFTAATWIKLDSLPGPAGYIVISKWTNGIEDVALGVGSTGSLFFATHPCGTAITSTSSVLNLGQWHHVAVVHDGLQNRIYIDGQQVGSGAVCDPMWNAHGNLYLGASFRTDGVPPRYLAGQLDDIQWYQRALSGPEIQSIFQGGAIPTTLVLNPISDVTATTGFAVSGTLSNTNTGEPVTGQLITFTGPGVTPSLQAVTTDGVDFVGDINLVSCPVPASPSPGDCVTDELNKVDGDLSDNMILHLGVGGKIIFPEGTIGAKLWIQDMGSTSFKYVVQEGNGVVQAEAESSGSQSVVPIVNIISGYSDVGGDFVQNELEEITITEVGGTTSGSVGIAAILTTNPDGLPGEQHQINFEEFAAGSEPSPFTVNAGNFFSVGFAQNVASNGPLGVTAHFAGDTSYLGDDSNTEEYNVIFNTRGTQGEGAQVTSNNLGGSITSFTCTTDGDNDGICRDWEEIGLVSGVPGLSGSYTIPITTDSRKDIYVEIDCMLQDTSGNYCPTAADLTAVTTAFSRENIDLHITLTGADTNIPFNNPFHIWSAADGDANLRNDFENVKLDFFGTPTERSQGTAGTLRSGKDLLELKAQIYHYGVFVKNINSGTNTACGPSGQAELYGNDFVVSLGCAFSGAKGSVQEIQGTLMHELGHNLGLKHGGLDDDNCKPNHISVMNYARQLPWTQLGATNSGTTVNWALTYSREDLDNLDGPDGDSTATVGETLLDESAVKENFGLKVTAGQWSGTLPAGYQFKLIWGQPPNVRTGVTGASVNWDNDNNLAETTAFAQDLNKITGMAGCAPGSTILGELQSYDEFANLDLKFRDGSAMDGLVFPDPDTISELTPEVLEGVSSTVLTLEPIADVSAGGLITATGVLTDLSGNPLANEQITFSGTGAENLLAVTTNTNGIYTSSGNSPASVAIDWEVEAHFAGTEDNGPANSSVELYDTLDSDNNPPTVTSTTPADGDTDVGLDVTISAEFSEAMNDATITTSTFTLEGPSGPITGTVAYDPDTNTATFDPASDLAQSTEYTATISSTVQDSAGNPMGADYVWSFTTESAALTILGFYAPTDMEDGDGNPIVNSIKAGRSVPLKFEVFDNSNVEQTSTSIVQSFMQNKINCATLQGEPVDPVELTNTGGTGLRYDAEQGVFVQNWKTPSQAGSCYEVTLTTTDGSSITAYFKLLK